MSLFGRSTGGAAEWQLRTSLVVLLLVAITVVFGVIGAGVLAYRVPAIVAEDRAHMRGEALGQARYFEDQLGALEGRLGALRRLPELRPQAHAAALLDDALSEGGFQAIYLLDETGRVELAAVPEGLENARHNLRGADLSRNPLFLGAQRLSRRTWSDRYLSPLTGNATVGVAVPAGRHVLLGELSPDFARDTILHATSGESYPLLVVDRAGEPVVGQHLGESDLLRNWSSDLEGIGDEGEAQLGELRFSGTAYDTGIARSGRLGWTFMVAWPAGHDNPRVRITVLLVLGGLLGSTLLALMLAPLWAARLGAPLQALTARTRALAAGDRPAPVARSRIREINQLAADMDVMAQAVRQRQADLELSEDRLRRSLQELRQLNADLESRVERRTAALARANKELSQALANLQKAQAELIRTEKLASLGNLVGGVAHELNTPIGNGVMAVSTLHDEVQAFRRDIADGVRRSTLEAFVGRVEQGTAIALRNLQRASELIASFKQVAVDQTSMQRRRFLLDEVVDEILLTLQPTIRRTPFAVGSRVPGGLALDSYPGSLGQVLTNLVGNAIAHGLEGRAAGTVDIAARRLDDGMIEIEVADDGADIPPELHGRIFEPFVTGKPGRGGTGLGLHIVWNAVTAVLGGSIAVDSAAGQGTRFRIVLPAIAPRQAAAG